MFNGCIIKVCEGICNFIPHFIMNAITYPCWDGPWSHNASHSRSWYRPRDSEVLMFLPCVFVCVWLSVYVCHDVCPDNLTMKDWCHTNNSLKVCCWGCLVVQVMFHAIMTSLMTSQDHKVGQILKLIYLRQYLSYSVDQKLKMSEMLMAIFLVYSTSGITSGKKVCRELKMAAIF